MVVVEGGVGAIVAGVVLAGEMGVVVGGGGLIVVEGGEEDELAMEEEEVVAGEGAKSHENN